MASKADLEQAVERLEHRMDRLGSDLRGEMNRLHADILQWMFAQAFVILACQVVSERCSLTQGGQSRFQVL